MLNDYEYAALRLFLTHGPVQKTLDDTEEYLASLGYIDTEKSESGPPWHSINTSGLLALAEVDKHRAALKRGKWQAVGAWLADKSIDILALIVALIALLRTI